MYMNFWYPIAAADEVKSDAPFRTQVLGLRFVAFRTKDGRAHVLSDVCVHRGGSLGKGWVRDDAVGHDDADEGLVEAHREQLRVGLRDELRAVRDEDHAPADRELAFLDDHWTATADPRRWQATRDWLAGRGMLTRGDRLGALRSLVKAAAADPALARRLATAAIRRQTLPRRSGRYCLAPWHAHYSRISSISRVTLPAAST